MADAWQTTPGPPPRSRGERNDAQNPRSSREALLTAPRTYTLATRPRTNQTSAPVGVASTNYNNTYVSANGTPYVPTSGTAQPSASYSVSYAPANPTTYSAISEDVQNAARGSQDSYYTQGTVTYSIAPQSQPRPRPQAVNPMDMPNVPREMQDRRAITFQVPTRPGFVVALPTYFEIGRVFQADVPEPADAELDVRSAGTVTSGIFLKPRMYIVMERRHKHFVALGLFTHGSRGVGADPFNRSDHCIAYSGSQPPVPLRTEETSDPNNALRPDAVRIVTSDRTVQLDQRTRINLGREYSPLDYRRLSVRHIGDVHIDSLVPLLTQWLAVREEKQQHAARRIARRRQSAR